MQDPTKITLKAKHSLNQGVMLVQPCKRPDGYGFYGVENYSEEEKRKMPFVITADTTFKVKHNMVIDLADPWQYALWEGFVKHDSRIAKDSEDAANNPFCLYYVDDEETKVIQSVSTYRERNVLNQWFEALEDREKKEVCALLNYRTDGNNMMRIDEFLLKKINDGDGWRNVKEVRGWMENGYAAKIHLVKKLVEKKILQSDNKWYYYGGGKDTPRVTIGDSMEKVIYWLGQRENMDQVRRWMIIINEKNVLLTLPTPESDNIFAEPDSRSTVAEPHHRDIRDGIENSSALDLLMKEMNHDTPHKAASKVDKRFGPREKNTNAETKDFQV